jgi:hypothetical protein
MGQWGLETSAGDSVHDYLQEIQVDTSKFRQWDVKPLLDYTWKDIQATVRDKLGVVMHLLTHELIVPIDKLEEVMEIANKELHPDQLASWSDKVGRKAMVVIEMNDIRHALDNKGKGRARHAQGLLEKMADMTEENDNRVEDTLNAGEKTIELPCYGIVVELTGDGGGSITSDLKETCSYCNDSDCDMGCQEFLEHCSDRDIDEQLRKSKERFEFLCHRAAADTLESFIMSCACSGLDIETPAFIEAIETTMNALMNADYTVDA